MIVKTPILHLIQEKKLPYESANVDEEIWILNDVSSQLYNV